MDEAVPDTLSLEELRRRLVEAEDTLRAIREGDADAVVVRNANEDTVFALSGGQESYRAIMEAMDIGAIALDDQGRVLYANAAFCALIGCAATQLQHLPIFEKLDANSAQVVRETIEQARHGRHQVQFVQSHRGSNRHLMVTAAPLPMAFGTGCALTFSDVTARVEAAALEESERIGEAVIASANEAVVVCDRAGNIIKANAAASALMPGEAIGRHFTDALPLAFAEDGGISTSDGLLDLAAAGSAARGVEAFAFHPDARKDLLVSVAPLRVSGETIGGSVITLVDLSERKAFEKRQTLMMHELDHRVKNTLAMVLSICGRTLAGSDSLEEFRLRFTRRIQALAATHSLLADASWAGIDLAALIETELAPYVSAAGPHLAVSKLERTVAPDVAIAFGLVVHELATNAVKYGALSAENGKVTVSGSTLNGNLYEVVWAESGGPPVTPPIRQGFGQTLITRSLARGEGTGATVDFAPDGVVCRMVLPIEVET
jgi:PAS domain S-box-containing protein